MSFIQREPVAFATSLLVILAALFGVAASFGLKLTPDQQAAITGLLTAIVGFWTRSRVSPVQPPSSGDKPSGDAAVGPKGGEDVTDRSVVRIRAAQLVGGLCFLLWLPFAPALVSCSSSQTPQAQAVQARQVARAAYASTAIALKTLGEVHYAWQKSRTAPTREELELDGKILAAFDASRAALEAAKPWVSTGDGGDKAKEKLLEALDMAALAASVLASVGGKVPDEATEALAAARALLGGAS